MTWTHYASLSEPLHSTDNVDKCPLPLHANGNTGDGSLQAQLTLTFSESGVAVLQGSSVHDLAI